MTHDLPSTGGGSTGSPEPVSHATQPVRARRSRVPLAGGLLVVLAAVILAVLLHHGTLGESHVPGQAARTSTETPKPRILYAADWTQGTDGWALPAHWRLVDGHLESDGYGAAPLLIPYQVTTQEYSVAVDFTVESIPSDAATHSYGIEGLSTGGTLQFLGGIQGIRHLAVAYHGFSENFIPHADSQRDGISTNDYTVSYSTQTFTVQVQGHNVGFCPGISCMANLNSTTPLWPIQMDIYDNGVQLSITRVVITSP